MVKAGAISRLVLAGALVAAPPAFAQSAAPGDAPATLAPGDAPATLAPGDAPATLAPDDGAVQYFYATHPGTSIWLKDADSRAAAAKLAGLLRDAAIDGVKDGAALAAGIDAALATGQPTDDQTISAAWVRYVEALERPVAGVSYGDPALQLKPSSAESILTQAAAAPSLGDHVERVAGVNPLYAALREAAIAAGQQSDVRVRATLDRLRLVPARGRAILVDAASQQLWMLEDGRPAGSMKVVVGKTNMPTPLLAGTIHFVTFNPYWHIPDDVARRKVAPLVLKRGVSYLKAARYETAESYKTSAPLLDPVSIDWKGVAAGTSPVYIRQLPGEHNMMGKMKFGFDNDFDIFLHDTPHKELFAKAQRTFSMGCVRLEHADELGRWLLGRDPVAPDGDEPEQNVQLDKGVPVYVTYLTATADQGQLAFASDVYGLDKVSEGTATAVASASGPSAR